MKVEIWSDVMCPFCYIGKRQFEQALKQFGHSNHIQIEWRSFQLNPGMEYQSRCQYQRLPGRVQGLVGGSGPADEPAGH